MKHFFLILITITILSCNDKKAPYTDGEKEHMELHKEMEKVDREYQKFHSLLVQLYTDGENDPRKVLLEIDNLIALNKKEKDKYKSQIKSNINEDLYSLKAELYYKLGKYNESIKELNNNEYKSGDVAAAYAANYIKLKDHKKAKSFIDSIGIGYYIYDYALANYYECVGNKTEALKIYKKIQEDKTIKHYAYYKLAVNRLDKLQKNNAKLLDEIYYPTQNPNFEIADSDNENRTKIFNLMQDLPENQEWAGTSIIESPQINDKNYYWVRVTNKDKEEFNYYIYQETFEIKFFNPKTKKLLSLEEWRKENKN
ncbi:tetratricopeptide repeat protein [Flavobacterium hydatis]|uniref:Lipoprotein n=1 Tax=Flavobacterium hydatis TaxID=991 RepID=A0A085ZTX8_FLAHY|nr:hypothetical protein [Flavobacterium hydatis]KFF07892.1 hypothetical protein IW20_23960 [Flavobacterium hydatis]OXA94205.1 hypothetical protein B0A62_11140 [Flavobacterium hydatis]